MDFSLECGHDPVQGELMQDSRKMKISRRSVRNKIAFEAESWLRSSDRLRLQ